MLQDFPKAVKPPLGKYLDFRPRLLAQPWAEIAWLGQPNAKPEMYDVLRWVSALKFGLAAARPVPTTLSCDSYLHLNCLWVNTVYISNGNYIPLTVSLCSLL